MSSRRLARRAATLIAGLTAAATLGMLPQAGAARPSGPSIVLDTQSEWVEPGATSATAPFELTLSISGAPATAVLSVRLFGAVNARSTLQTDETRQTGPTGRPRTTSVRTLAVSTLPTDGHLAGAVDLDLGIATSATAAYAAQSPRQTVDLDCTIYTCPGVYPVEIVLSDGTGTTLAHLTTFCTYVNAKSTHPLEFALVLPVDAAVGESAAGDPLHAVRKLPPSTATSIETLADQVHATSGVDLTIEPSPETLQRLWSGGTSGKTAVRTLAALSQDQSDLEVPAQPYVPIDLASLAGAGEKTEVVAQMDEGQGILRQLGVKTTPAATGVWVADDGGPGLTTGLAEVGATRLVVPEGDLTATSRSVATATTYPLRSSATTRMVAPSDPTVTAELSDSALTDSDAALAASDLLADLAFVHFEAPNTPTTRGIVGLPPAGWHPHTAFDQVLLSGLQGNPVVKPVTLSEFFDSVSETQTTTIDRQLTFTRSGAKVAPALTKAAASALSTARLQLTAFDTAVTAALAHGTQPPAVLTQLDQLLLCSETTADEGAGDAKGIVRRLAVFRRALDSQLDQVSIVGERDGGQDITLTARTGFIPVTVVSHLPYAVRGMLTVKSRGAKFQFIVSNGRVRSTTDSHQMTLSHPTNSWRFDVRARSSGELPLSVTFSAGDGALVFAADQLSIRSTATSLAGIVLTVAALVVLLGWWARTWWSGRRRRRAAENALPAGA